MAYKVREYFGGGKAEEKLTEYVISTCSPEDETLRKIRERAERIGVPPLQVRRMDGLHLEVLTRASGAVKAVEIGTLVGYSAICIARGLGNGGKLFTCEIVPAFAEMAADHFAEAGLSDRIDVLTGPAKETLNALSTQAPFDLVFIDADKESYPDYFRFAEKHLRRGGLLIADNALVFGNIADEKFDDPELGRMAEGVREFNRLVTTSEHFRATILPTGDGMVLAVKTR